MKKALSWIYHSLIWVVVLLFVLDLASKLIIVSTIPFGEQVWIIPNFFCFTNVRNTGMAFSIGANELTMRIIFIIVSAVVGFGLLIYYCLNWKKYRLSTRICLVMLIAGALGNLVDRAFYWSNDVSKNGVIDWLEFYIFGPPPNDPFAVFNIADAVLVIGVILLIVFMIVDEVKKAIEKNKKGEYSLTPDEQKLKELEDNKARESEKNND